MCGGSVHPWPRDTAQISSSGTWNQRSESSLVPDCGQSAPGSPQPQP